MLIENINRLLKQNKYLFESLKDKANKATTLSGYGIADAYTKTEIDNKVSIVFRYKGVVFRYKGSVSTYVDLTALTGMTIGDVYNVTETGDNYAWTGTEWDKLAGEIDLSAYLTLVDASNTYETIANVNSLSTIVSGNTEDISDLQTDKADKATTLAGYAITDAYTKTEIDNKVSAVYKFKGSVNTYADLPATNQVVGDVYNVNDTGINYAWDGTEWDNIGGIEPLATDTNNGLMSKEDFSKLAGIEAGAEANINADWNAITGDAQILNKPTTISGYGITDSYTKTEIDTSFENHKTYSNVTHEDLLALISNNELVPNSSYRITDYTTTTVQADTQSAGHNFDVIVTALSTNELSEIASAVQHDGDTYFANSNLEAWEIKYCINNDTSKFAWADAVNGKGVIYYMKDEWGNECPYDFKNIQYQTRALFKYSQWGDNYTFRRDSSLDTIIEDVQYYGYVCVSIPSSWSSNTCWLRDNPATTASVMYNSSGSAINYGGNITAVSNENYDVYTFSKTKTASEDFDVSLNGLLYYCYNNTIRPYFTTQEHKQVLNRITFVGWDTGRNGLYCFGNTFENNCYDNTFEQDCNSNTFGNECQSNTFGYSCNSNTFGNSFLYNTSGHYCQNNTFENNCKSNTLGNGFNSNTLGNSFNSNTFDYGCKYNTFGNECQSNTFGNNCKYNTFGNNCSYNNFYTGTSGTTKKNYIQYIVLEDGCSYNNFYSELTTSSSSYLQRIRIKGLQNTTATDTQITLSATNTNYEWLICYTSSAVLKQYCPND
ncbi:MAG TPA: hypothetical protein PLG47_01445 [Candidatus Dojkabacteria bacterium]|nr:hypothetical protein [Candidatus Dojkabacteria bacterium]